ncbi:MAG: hypothetical protein CMJ48_09405 [Planctomycetaceae bacterium]|nr:hypothetical protein [Planctomycetaceae bacterium]
MLPPKQFAFVAAGILMATVPSQLEAFQEDAETPQKAVVQREAVRVTAAEAYQTVLQLEPAVQLRVSAAVDGVVQSVQTKPGASVGAQNQMMQLDETRFQILVTRAQAGLKIAQLKLAAAEKGGQAADVELAKAQAEAAKAEVELTEMDLDATKVRAPFAGKVMRIHVTPGQFVRAGTPLLTLADTSTLQVELPVDRAIAKPGAKIDLKIESTTASGTVQHLVPLPTSLAPLRSLAESIVSAVVTIENKTGTFSAGQAVHSPLIPRLPVAEISTVCLKNTGDGRRKVQVVRDNVVRDVVIAELGQVGEQRINVSGAFQAGDEVIVGSSQALVDGTHLLPAVPEAETSGNKQKPGTRSTINKSTTF